MRSVGRGDDDQVDVIDLLPGLLDRRVKADARQVSRGLRAALGVARDDRTQG
jgi:hypothetical protein